MCVAVLAKPGAIVHADKIRGMFRANGDGGGLAYCDKVTGEVVIKKGFMNVEDMVKGYQEVLDAGHAEKNPVILHVRAATLGRVNADNCHPFPVKGGAMIHNGILWSSYGVGNPRLAEKSDTREFAERLHGNLVYEDVAADPKALLRTLGGGFNKLVFLYDGGKYVIVNEEVGGWEDNVWYSNKHWSTHNIGTYRS